MSKVKIKQLRFNYFKGIRNLTVDFNTETPTDIFGRNATGKTSIFDGFTWLLFGKDSQNRKDFEIKTLDADGKPISKIEHSVSAILEIDGVDHTAKRVYKEKWVKRRGSDEVYMSGNEQELYFDDVPLKVSEYDEKINSIIDESLFRLITNPMYYNENMKWEERRKLLLDMANPVSESDILNSIADGTNQTQIDKILEMLNLGKSDADFKKEIAAKKKRINDDMAVIPTRIDEANKQRPDESKLPELEKEKGELESNLKSANDRKENQIKSDNEHNQTALSAQKENNDRKLKLQTLEQELNAAAQKEYKQLDIKIRNADSKAQDAQQHKSSIEQRAKTAENELTNINNQLDELRTEWTNKNAETFVRPDDKLECPTCGTPFSAEKVAEMETGWKTKFEQNKANQLNVIKSKADNLTQRKDELEAILQTSKTEIGVADEELQKAVATVKELKELKKTTPPPTTPDPTPEMVELKNQIDSFVLPEQQTTDFTEINESIQKMQSRLSEVKNLIHEIGLGAKIDARIKELQDEEDNLAQQLTDLEALEFTLDRFRKERTETLIESVNQKFKFVKFRLFEEQINGGERECCDTLINTNGSWVEWGSTNTAGRINGGVDIINAICQHNGVFAPIFIDNRESVDELIYSDSQVVNLIKRTDDKEIRVQ